MLKVFIEQLNRLEEKIFKTETSKNGSKFINLTEGAWGDFCHSYILSG